LRLVTDEVFVAASAMLLPWAFDRSVPYRKPRVGAGEELSSGTNPLNCKRARAV
jgi:hypothetical protein